MSSSDDEASSEDSLGGGGGGGGGEDVRHLLAPTIAALKSDLANESEKIAHLTALCDALAFTQYEEDLHSLPLDEIVLLLVVVAGKSTAEVTLMSVRALTYFLDLVPASARAIVKYGGVAVLCSPLMGIEYLDVAEQCLDALEKLSMRESVACLKEGVIMAVLSFVDFFEASMQRVALSTVNNVCKKIPEDYLATASDAVPTLCNLLEHQDRKIVESAATSLIRIVENFSCSSELLDKLCKDGIVKQCVEMISPDSRMMLSENTYTGMIGLLVRLSTHSLEAVRILYELNISSLLETILRSSDLSCNNLRSPRADMSNDQMYVTLRWLNQLVPPISSDEPEFKLVLSKKNIIMNQPDFLRQFAMHTIPALVQVVNSGANTCLSFGCVSILKNYVSFVAPDMLRVVIKTSNMSCFLASLISRKDHHVVIPALNIVEIFMNNLPGESVNSFVKEGVLHAMRALYSSQSELLDQQSNRCLCYAFDCSSPSSKPQTCRIQKNTLSTLAEHIMSNFFTETLISRMGLSENIRNLKAICTKLDSSVSTSTSNPAKREEYLSQILNQVFIELSGRESMCIFEFIESGLVRSLANYLSYGKYLHRSLNSDSELDAYHTVLNRLQIFSSMSLSGQSWEEVPLTFLVRHLQKALSLLDFFPVILSSAYEPGSRVTDIPANNSSMKPCLYVNFVKGEEEIGLCDYGSVLTIEFSTSNDVIEGFLWPKVSKKEAALKRARCNKKQHSGKKPKDLKTDIDQLKSSTSQNSEDCFEPNLVFVFNGKPVDPKVTLYQAILQEKINADSDIVVDATFWIETHTVTYRRVKEKHPCSTFVEKSVGLYWQKHSFFSTALLGKLPGNMENSNPTHDILFLLKILHGLNEFSFQLRSYEGKNTFSEGRRENVNDLKVVEISIPQNEFISNKLTDKLVQQMHDSLAISTGTMPMWCNQLVVACPFLFSFEARWKYFCLNAFGSLRNQTQNSGKNSINTVNDRRTLSAALPRKRFKVNRKNILGSAAKMMTWYARRKTLLDIEFYGEVGTGLGPTLEFYTLVSQKLQKVGMHMWRGDHGSLKDKLCPQSSEVIGSSNFIRAPCGLFPRPLSGVNDLSNGINFSKVLKNFFLLGQLIARAIRDGRMLDLPFSRAFYKLILDQDLDIYDILSFDPELGKTLIEFQALVSRKRFSKSQSGNAAINTFDIYFQNTRIEELCLDFTLPGYPDYFLASDSNLNMVNASNLEEYVSMVIDATLRSGISRQLESFKAGFDTVFPIKTLQIFCAEELERMICGEQNTWDLNELQDHMNFDHGYTSSSPPVMKFLEIIQEFDCQQRRAFLLFVTGAPRLPPGGLSSLNPKLTVVCKQCSNDVDEELPSVMTCVNYVKLPPYSSKEIMREKLLYAIMEGQRSFHLS